jgi:uncharacterized protein (TIGR03435 family)
LTLCSRIQGQQTGSHEFEVASIKPSPPPDGRGITVGCSGGPGTKDPAMLSCENMTLTMLVRDAYDIAYDRIVAPDWMSQSKFDVAARIPAGATKDQIAPMWRRLLTDRFKLAAHLESKVVAKYDLTVGPGGPKFKSAVEEAPANPNDQPTPPRAHGENKVNADGFPVLARPGMIGMNGRITLYSDRMTIDQLAKTISGQVGRPVADGTSLKGEYEIRLYWVAEGAGGPDASSGPTIIRAVQEQLGLKLESTRGPVEYLIVDHMEKLPSEN